MKEILTQARSEMRIVRNADGKYTAYVGEQQQTFDDVLSAAAWACNVCDGFADGGCDQRGGGAHEQSDIRSDR